MPRLHLTDITVKALKPTDRNVTYWDENTPGFGVRVGKLRKTWTVMQGADRKRITVGHYPFMTLSDARREARRLLTHETEKNPTIRFQTAQSAFLDENYRTVKPRTKKEAERLLTKHFAKLHAMNLNDIDDTDIERQLSKLDDRPSEQLHAYRALRCFLTWCTRPPRRYIKHSPMEGYRPPTQDRKRTRILSDDELKAIWNSCTDSFGDLVKLLVLWGTRNDETASIRREWVSNDVMVIPGDHTKNGRDHSIPLQPMAKEILTRQPPDTSYYFPGRTNTYFHYGSWTKLKKRLEKSSGVGNWQLRDLRRTFRSTMPRIGVDRDTAELLLNHAPSVLDEIYDRYDRLPEKREALLKYEAHIATIVSP